MYVDCLVTGLTVSLLLQIPLQPVIPMEMIPPHVAAGYYYNSNVTPVSHVPLVSYFSRGQADPQFAQVIPADLNWRHCMQSVSTAMRNPFIALPVPQYDLSPALMAEWNRRMRYNQQLFQQQILCHPFAAPDNNLLHPVAMPLTAPQCIPTVGTHPYPMINPVLRQPLVQTQPSHDPWKHQGQVSVDNVNSCRSWLSDAESRGEIWTTPADVKSIWSNAAAVRAGDLPLNVHHVSSREQKYALQPSVIGSAGALCSDIVDHYDAGTAKATNNVVTNQFAVTDTGLCDRQGIWPTAFGPFTRPPDSSVDSVSRLPPDLETRVFARIGVIGQRDSDMQKNASVEGYDSGVDSACGDGQDLLGHCSSSELTAASSASRTNVCVSGSASFPSPLHDTVEQQCSVLLQEPSTTNSSSSWFTDIIPSLNTQTAPSQQNVPLFSDNFTSNLRHCRTHSHSKTSGADTSVPSFSPYSDADRTANTAHKTGTSRLLSGAVDDRTLQTDNTVLLRDIIAQLSDMLHKPDELRFVDICNALYDRLAASSSVNSSSQYARLAGTLCESAVSSSFTDLPVHTSLSDGPFHNSASAAGSQGAGSLVDSTSVTAASHATICPTDTHTLIKCDHSHISSVSGTTQVDCNDDVSLPTARSRSCDTVSVTCSQAAANPDTLLTDVSSLHACDTAALQQVLSKVAEGHVKSLDKHKKHLSDSSVEDLLVLLQKLKS